MSTLEVNKITPAGSATEVTLGDSGDTLTLTAGANLTLGGSSTTITIPSGSTLNVASGGTISNSGTATGFGETMVPAFFAFMDGNQSISANTATLVQFDQERLDTSSAYNTSNYLFTPAVAGKYFLFASANVQAVHDQCTNSIIINRNAANDVAIHKVISLNSSSDREPSLAVSTIIDADTDDYFRVLVKTDFGSGTTITGETYPTYTFFGGYRITGA